MNQKHRVIKPFTSIETTKIGSSSRRCSIPVLPQANARLSTDISNVLQRRQSTSTAPTALPPGTSNTSITKKTGVHSDIIFTNNENSSSSLLSTNKGANRPDKKKVTSSSNNQLALDNEKLLLKVAALEAQNDKLRKHVAQAATHSETRTSVAAGSENSTGEPTVAALQAKLTDAYRRISSMQKASHHTGVVALSPRPPHVTTPRTAPELPTSASAVNDSVVQTLKATISSLEKKLKTSQERLEAAEEANKIFHQNNQEENRRLLEQLNSTQNVANESKIKGANTVRSHATAIESLQTLQHSHAHSIAGELTDFGSFLRDGLVPQITKLCHTLESKSTEGDSLRHDLHVSTTTVKALEADLEECKLKNSEVSTQYADLKVMYEELEKSVLAKKDAATATAHAVAKVLAAAAPTPAPQPHDNISIKSLQVLVAQLEEQKHNATKDREKYFTKYQSCHSTLTAIQKQFTELCRAHDDVVKTVKHSAHVKDLQKVAASRTLLLEKEKAESQLHYHSEVNNVLTFCLKTVETTLLETQPQVVIRVAEGRGKRLKTLERSNLSRNRDIEQRSTETLALGTAALEGFQIKADAKVEAAAKIWNDVVDKMTRIANASDSDSDDAVSPSICTDTDAVV